MSRQAAASFPTKRLKHVVSLRRSRVDGSEDNRPYVGLENIESATGKHLGNSAIIAGVEDTSLSNTFEAGEVLLGKLRPYLAKVWVAEFAGRATTEFLVMKPVEVEARFLRYVCLWRDFINAVDASTFGSKMPRADWDFIGSMFIPVPEWRKQRAIADYLDRETARLDALVAAKERLLDLLAEKRRALITRAVTRGLGAVEQAHPDPVAPVGLGDHAAVAGGDGVTKWPCAKLKYVARLAYGEMLPHDGPLDGIFHVYGSNGPFSSFSRANTGSPAIIVGRKGSYGKVNWTTEPCFASDTTFFVDGSTTRNHLRWLYWLLQTLHLDEGSDETAVPGLNRDTAYSKDVVVPPIHEQRAIADYLDRETARLDTLSSMTEDTIALLKERRASLISAAVTGQIDVKEEACELRS